MNKKITFPDTVPFGYATHKILLDKSGNPVDYEFLQVNKAFEKITGLKKENIIGRKVLDVLPGIVDADLDWISTYGAIALNGGEKEFDQYDKQLKKWFRIHVSSSEKMYFTTVFTDITDLKTSNEELERFFILALDLLCIADIDGNFLKVNKSWSDLLGYTTEELTQSKFMDFVHPEDVQPTLDAIHALSKKETVLNYVNRYRCKDGTYRFLEWRSRAEGDLIYAAARDITKRNEMLNKLQESEKRFREIFESLPLISVQGYDANRRVIFWNKASEHLYGYTKEEAAGRRLEDLIIPESLKDFVIKDIQNWIEHDIPIPSSELMLRKKDESMVHIFSSHVLLENYNDEKELFCIDLDLTEQIERQNELKRIKNQYQALTNNIPAIIYRREIHKNRPMIFINRYAKSITGYTSEELLHSSSTITYNHLIHRDDRIKVAQSIEKAIKENQSWEIEYRIIHKDGTEKWVYEKGQEILDNSTGISFLEGFIIEINETKLAQLERDELLERLNLISTQLPGFIYQYLLKPDGTSFFPYVSDGVTKTFNLCPSDLRNSSDYVFNMIHPDDIEHVKKSIVNSAANLIVWQKSFRINLQNGKTVWIEGNAKPQKLDDGSIIWHGFIHDITERKKKEEQIEYQKNILDALYKLSTLGIALNDYETGRFIDANPQLLKITGYSKKELFSLNYWDLTPKEYEKKESAALHQMDIKGYYDKFEKEYIRKDGSKLPISLRGVVITDLSGKKLIWSLIEDIRKEKKAENELAKLSSAIEQSPASVVITDTKGHIEYVNPKFTQVTGYSIAEAFGKNPNILKSGKLPKQTYKELWKNLITGKTWRGELLNKKKNGELYWEMASISPIIDLDGNTTHYLAVKEDITELKNAEQAILKSLKEKNVLLSEVHHRVKNNMATINSLLGLQIEFSDLDERTRTIIRELQTRVKSMAIVHELVYTNDNVSQIKLRDLIENISDNIESIFKVDSKDIKSTIDSDETSIDLNISVPFSLLMNELLTNIWKHAFSEQTEGLISVKIKSKGKILHVSVSDNGKGVSDLDKINDPNSYGYTIIHGLVSQLNGQISFSNISTGGLNVKLQFPLD